LLPLKNYHFFPSKSQMTELITLNANIITNSDPHPLGFAFGEERRVNFVRNK